MLEQSLRRLEFEKILGRVLENISSSGAREKLLARGFAVHAAQLQEWKAQCDEAIRLQLGFSPVPDGPLMDLSDPIKRAAIGGVLEPNVLLSIMDTLRTHRRVSLFFENLLEQENHFPRCFDAARRILPQKSLEERISEVVGDDGEVKSSASQKLAGIRRSIQSTEVAIRRKIESFLGDRAMADILQESLVTVRNERFVIPVKSEHKRRVPGMVHDRSASGNTLYIEPMALVEMNNELRELKNDEQAEIHRILLELSGQVGAERDAILSNHELTTHLFLLFGLGKFALSIGGNLPEISESRIVLRSARHPLLDPETVVPMDMDFGEDARILVITGPNTGGKTVSLKTLGLLCLMHQFGLPIPVNSGSQLPFFEDIYVDIGDEQSIEQSLSTFSSHMVNVVQILGRAREKSLVLLDELGAGTDPQEGAALARSILIELKERGSMVFATSHYSEIKEFALTQEGYENASVEFDVATLSPTYRLLMGVPGSSNAFAISRKLGMPEEILTRADHFLEGQSAELDTLLSQLEEQRIEGEEAVRKASEEAAASEKLRRELQEKMDAIQARREEMLEKAKEEARELLFTTQEEARSIMKELRSLGAGVNYAAMEEQQQRLRSAGERLQKKKQKKKRSHQPPLKLIEGEAIYIPHLSASGRVISVPDENGNFRAMVGILKMSLNIQDVQKVKEVEKTPSAIKKSAAEPTVLQTSLDLRGMDVETARPELDRFLAQAITASPPQLEIIHGKGTGVLRAFVQDYLKKNKWVAEYRYGGYHEGGDGVTLVKLK